MSMLPLGQILGADGRPLNGSLARVTGKPVELEPGVKILGDPEKTHHVHVDDRGAAPASLLTGGTAYTPTKKEVAEMCPAVVCPMCGITCIGFTDAVAEFPEVKDAPPELRRFVYKSERCGCMVTQEWVAAINAELNARTTGAQPKQVEELNPTQRKAVYGSLEAAMFKIMDKMQLAHVSERGPLEAQFKAYIKVMEYIGAGMSETITPTQAAQAAAEATTNIQFGHTSKLGKLAAAVKQIDAMQQAQLDKAVASYSDGSGYAPGYEMPKQKPSVTAKIDENVVLDQIKKITEQTMQALGIPPTTAQDQLAAANDAATKLNNRPVPSPDKIEKVESRLTSIGWEALIKAVFKNLKDPAEQLAIRDLILESIELNRNATSKAYHPAVDKVIFFLTFGSASSPSQPTAVQGTPQSTKPVAGTRPAAAAQPTTPQAIKPTVSPEQFHEQFKKKKRRIKRLPPSEET